MEEQLDLKGLTQAELEAKANELVKELYDIADDIINEVEEDSKTN